MPWNGSGVFVRRHDWTDDRDAGGNEAIIDATKMDEEAEDVKAGLENCVTRDGQNSPSADLPMNSQKHTGVGNATARNQYAAVGQVQDQAFTWVGTVGGTADAITLTPSPTITAYAAGQEFQFIASGTNTGAVTVNVSGLGAKSITKNGTSALVAGDIASGSAVRIIYDGTQFQKGTPPAVSTPVTTRGDVIRGNSSGEEERLALGASGQVLTSDGTDAVWANASTGNVLINGDFRVAQRGTTFHAATDPTNADDNYILDRWILLTEGSDIVDVIQETTTVPSGSYAAVRLDFETANAKAGILQVVEARNAPTGETVSLSFKARKGASNTTVDKLRAAILAWDSTADTVTSDVVSAWNAEGVDPTLVSNWTYENTPSDLTLTDSYQTFRIDNVSIDTASATNVAVFIWVDNDDATLADLVYITDVQLERGGQSTAFARRTYSQERELCRRYFMQMDPGTSAHRSLMGIATSTTNAAFIVPFFDFRAAPTVTYSSINIHDIGSSTNTVTAVTAVHHTEGVTTVNFTSSGLESSGHMNLRINTSGYVRFDCEL